MKDPDYVMKRTFRSKIIEGEPSSTRTPPIPPNLQVLPSAQVRRSKTSGPGAPGQAESGSVSQALVGACRRRSASEGSLSIIVEGSLDTDRIRRGGKVRGDHEHAGKGSGVGSGHFTIGESGRDKETLLGRRRGNGGGLLSRGEY